LIVSIFDGTKKEKKTYVACSKLFYSILDELETSYLLGTILMVLIYKNSLPSSTVSTGSSSLV
jgi:hypothetical protein